MAACTGAGATAMYGGSQANTPCDAVRVAGGSLQRDHAAIAVADEGDAAEVQGVEHGDHVLDVARDRDRAGIAPSCWRRCRDGRRG